MVSQLKGVSAAVGLPTTIRATILKQPWRSLWPGVIPRARFVYQDSQFLDDESPRLLVSCGRQAVPASLMLKKKLGSRIFTVHIQDPKIATSRFDLVVAPEHDGLRGTNVLSTMGAVHHITPELLAKTSAAGMPVSLASLKRPFVTVLLGGPTRHYEFSAADMTRLADRVEAMIAGHGVGVAILPSRRTPDHAVELFRSRFGRTQMVWDRSGDNPYLAALAFSSHIVVTGDSVSMVTEAAGTGRPVFIEYLTERRPARRFRELHQSFERAGIARPFAGELSQWSYEPRNESAMVARVILERMEL